MNRIDPSDRGDAQGRDEALTELLGELGQRNYRFVTPTPATHARVLANRESRAARDLRDVLGWSLPFASGAIDPAIEALLRAADMLVEEDRGWRSRIRVSSLRGRLFIHSAYPTDAVDAVFFGPDSYRFADVIAAELSDRRGQALRIVDIGAGAGVGALVAGDLCPGAELMLTDINAEALRFAAINAAAAGFGITRYQGRDLAGARGPFDAALANPPFLIDTGRRSYRHGGGRLGAEVSLDIARAAAAALAPGGRLVLYTGSVIVDGVDRLRPALEDITSRFGLDMAYREIDPDVFGEELDSPACAAADRIAVVAAVLRKG